jgi:tetratricopeptide (TPR) repeat protein
VLTLLEVCRVRWGIKPMQLARESGYSRAHLHRVRTGDIEPSRDCIAAIVSAFRRVTLQDVQAHDLFELTTEVSGAWRRQRRQQVADSNRAWRKERKANAFLLDQLRKAPADEWRALVGPPAVPVVRALLLEARTIFDRTPTHAEALATLALAVLEDIKNLRPPYANALRANAALERANALRQLGNLPSALVALDIAEAACEGEPECTHVLGRVWLCRATVRFKMGDFDRAEQWLRLSVNVFGALDDQLRLAKVRTLQANLLFERGAFERAREEWMTAIPALTAAEEKHTLAVVWLNLGWCETELGNVAAASQWAGRARDSFVRMRSHAEELRARWCEARLVALHGERDDGVRELIEVREGFRRRKLSMDEGMVALDIGEALLLPPSRPRLATIALHGILSLFVSSGATREVGKALAYLAEAAKQDRMRSTDVQHVREFIKRSEREPDATFEPLAAAGPS